MNKTNANFKDYPKVLLLFNTIGDKNGTEITLKNLFKDWPKEKIAISSMKNIDDEVKERIGRFYHLSRKEINVIWPLNYFIKVENSKSSNHSNDKDEKSSLIKIGLIRKVYTLLVKKLLFKTGIYYIKFHYKVSRDFEKWLFDYHPDIIYTTFLGDVSSMRFALSLKKLIGCKLAIHIMDDWINTFPNSTIFPFFWKKKYDDMFLEVLNNSEVKFSISKKMSKEYYNRYKISFIPFHNPVVIEDWKSLKNNVDNNVFTYVGKINDDTIDVLTDFSNAIEKISISNNLFFNIYSLDNNVKFEKILRRNLKTKIFKKVSHKEIPQILMNSYGLFLPLSFGKSNRKYTKYSMPTKVSEFMISMTPIIVYAPKEIALYEYAREFDWAILVGQKGEDHLIKAIKTLLYNDQLVNEITKNAYKLAVESHSIDIVSSNFKKMLINAAI